MTGGLFLYLEELFLYQLGAYVCFTRKIRMPWAQIAGAVISMALIRVSWIPDSLIVYMAVWIVVILSMTEAWKERFSHFAMLLILLTGLEEMLDLLKNFYVSQIDTVVWTYIVRFFIVSVFLFVIWFLRKFIRKKEVLMKSGMFLSPILLTMAIIALFLTVLGLVYAYPCVDKDKFVKYQKA